MAKHRPTSTATGSNKATASTSEHFQQEGSTQPTVRTDRTGHDAKHKRKRFEDCIKVGDGMVVTGSNVVVESGTLAAVIMDAERQLDDCGEKMVAAKTHDENFEVDRMLKRLVNAINHRWEGLKVKAMRYDCFTHGDLYGFEQRLNDWVDGVCENIRTAVKEDRTIWANSSALTPGELMQATDVARFRQRRLNSTAHNLISEAVALENRLEDIVEAQKDDDRDTPDRVSPPRRREPNTTEQAILDYLFGVGATSLESIKTMIPKTRPTAERIAIPAIGRDVDGQFKATLAHMVDFGWLANGWYEHRVGGYYLTTDGHQKVSPK